MSNELFTSPGEFLQEILEVRAMTQKELALRLDISEKHMSNIINSKSELTYSLANKLSLVFSDTSSSFWNSVEAKYRESIEMQNWVNSLDNENLIEYSKRFRFSEIIKGRIGIKEKAIGVLKLLNLTTFDNFEKVFDEYGIAFHKDKGSYESMVLWMKLAEQNILAQNEHIDSGVFNKEKLKTILPRIKRLLLIDNKEIMIKRIRKLLNSIGVYFVVTPNITKSSIRGALTEFYGVPVIHSTMRFKTHDNFCFSLMHEIGHLLFHNLDTHIEYTKGNSICQIDIEANNFSRDYLINQSKYDEFVEDEKYNRQDVENFSINNGILPGILVGRLQHDRIIERTGLNELKVSFK